MLAKGIEMSHRKRAPLEHKDACDSAHGQTTQGQLLVERYGNLTIPTHLETKHVGRGF
jgi:hypothetical protein